MLDEELVAVFSAIAETLFDTELSPLSEPVVLQVRGALTARIDYRGSFAGSLSATVDEQLARRLTSIMMKITPASCTRADLYDALGEVVNIAAGNLKGLLPGDCQVSLPHVQEAALAAHDELHSALSAASFALFGAPVRVELRGDSVFPSD
jgi:chemotaxis protein CheY-P-specific phosphatase CheC